MKRQFLKLLSEPILHNAKKPKRSYTGLGRNRQTQTRDNSAPARRETMLGHDWSWIKNQAQFRVMYDARNMLAEIKCYEGELTTSQSKQRILAEGGGE